MNTQSLILIIIIAVVSFASAIWFILAAFLKARASAFLELSKDKKSFYTNHQTPIKADKHQTYTLAK